jgi:hypothetical protein
MEPGTVFHTVLGQNKPCCPEITDISILYPCGTGTQGDPSTANISHLLCVPIRFSNHPDSFTRAILQLPADTSSSGAGGTWRRSGR